MYLSCCLNCDKIFRALPEIFSLEYRCNVKRTLNGENILFFSINKLHVITSIPKANLYVMGNQLLQQPRIASFNFLFKHSHHDTLCAVYSWYFHHFTIVFYGNGCRITC